MLALSLGKIHISPLLEWMPEMSISLPILALPLEYGDAARKGRPVGYGVKGTSPETSTEIVATLAGWSLPGDLSSMTDDARLVAYVFACDYAADGMPLVDSVRLAWRAARDDARNALARAYGADALDVDGPTALDIPDARPTAPDSVTRYTLADMLADAADMALRDMSPVGMVAAAILLGTDKSSPFGPVWHHGNGMADYPRRAALSALVRIDVTESMVSAAMALAGESVTAARAARQARQDGGMTHGVWTDSALVLSWLARVESHPAPALPSHTPVSSYGSGPASMVTESTADARQAHPVLNPYAIAPWHGDRTDDASPTRDADSFALRDSWSPGRVATPSRRSGRRGQTGPTVPVRLSR